MKMHRTLLASSLLGLVAVFSAPQPAFAQDKYPSRPIEFVVPWGPGGGADQLARKIAPALEKELKVSLPVINVAGATGQTGLNKMLTSATDGYSISIFIADTLAVQMDPATKWKIEDIVPTAVMIRQPSAFFVAETSPLKTWKAKATSSPPCHSPSRPSVTVRYSADMRICSTSNWAT